MRGALNEYALLAHETAVEHGWWEADRNQGEIIANIHSEVTEAWKEWVHGHEANEEYYTHTGIDPQSLQPDWLAERAQRWLDDPSAYAAGSPAISSLIAAGFLEPHGVPTELADIMIRVLDMFAANDLDADRIVQDKMKFNDTRPYKHGGKRA